MTHSPGGFGELGDLAGALGPLLPVQFFSGQLPADGHNVLVTAHALQLWLITNIDVAYDGSGTAPLITFGINSGQPFWGSAPNSGTFHTEQWRGLAVLAAGDSFYCDGDISQWGLAVSGWVMNQPAYAY